MKIKISGYEYSGNSYGDLQKNIFSEEPRFWGSNADNKIFSFRQALQCEIVEEFEDPDNPHEDVDFDKILSHENWAKKIWDNVIYHYPELCLEEALPLKRWFKVNWIDEFGEANSDFFLAIDEEDAESLCACELRENGDQGHDFKVTHYLSSREEKKLAEEDEIAKFMCDDCTRSEALKHIKAGSISVLAAEWDEFAVENDYCDDDDNPITLTQLRSCKADGFGIVTAPDGGEYVLLYVL